ncbi:hypothetical protein VOLCADRAFT_66357, partial [Volvox carteri f. nagariensis]
GYNASVDPSIDVFFSTVAYRYGHSEVTDIILRVDDEGNEIPEGHLLLSQAYFKRWRSGCRGLRSVAVACTTDEFAMPWGIVLAVVSWSLVKVLTQLYGTPDKCDAYVCGLAERKLPGSHFGPLFNASLTDQYLRVRDGDWWASSGATLLASALD